MSVVKSTFCLWGYSGHGFVVCDSILRSKNSICGYFDLVKSISDPYGLKYLGAELNSELLGSSPSPVVFPSVGDGAVRARMVASIRDQGCLQESIVDPTALISTVCHIGVSTYVGAGATLNSLSSIGIGCIVNTGSIVEHECFIDDFCHIAPGVVLAGNVSVGKYSFIGANSTIKQGVKIGSGVIVGAGSVVLCDIPNNEVWVGNPAKRLR